MSQPLRADVRRAALAHSAQPVPSPAVRRPPPVGLAKKSAFDLANNGRLVRALFWPVRRFKPILALRGRVVVTRHDDVREVLSRDEDFTIAEVNAAAMDRVNGPFILGMDRSPQYVRERSILEQCVQPGDADRIHVFVRSCAADLVAAARPTGRIDVVNDLARLVAIRLVADYFGVAGPNEETMMRWMRTIFHETFLNVGSDPRVRAAGEASAAELHAYVDELIGRRRADLRAGAVVPDDFVTRLVRMQAQEETRLADEGIRRNIGGVIVGAVETTSKATAHAVDELLRRPAALAGATRAARSGDAEAVGRHVFEALRFNPINPVLARRAARPTVLAAGTRREQCIPAGCHVYAAILPAMFDSKAFKQAGRFRADRPAWAYLHFGDGLHTCFGRYVNLIQVPEIVSALLSLNDLRRASGRGARIVYDGPFPDRLLLEFDPGPNDGP